MNVLERHSVIEATALGLKQGFTSYVQKVISQLVSQQQEITKIKCYGFIYKANLYVDSNAQKAGMILKLQGMTWPSLHQDLHNRMQALVDSIEDYNRDLKKLKQLLSIFYLKVESLQDLRDATPDVICQYSIRQIANLPRVRSMEEVMNPEAYRRFLKHEETIDYLGTVPLIYS